MRRHGKFKDFFFLKKKVYHGSVELARVDPPLLSVPIERPAAEDMEAIDAFERDPLLQVAIQPDRSVGRSLQRPFYLIICDESMDITTQIMLNNSCIGIVVGSKLTIAVIEIALQGPRKLTGIRR